MQNITESQNKFIAQVSSWKFNLFLFYKLPAAFISGVRLKAINREHASVTVPYKWLSQNPFKSTYFACLAMAAELSTGILAMTYIQGYSPGISMLVTGMEAQFTKKATGVSTFVCEDGQRIRAAVEKAVNTGEGVEIDCISIGRNQQGEELARFTFKWSLKQKSSRKR